MKPTRQRYLIADAVHDAAEALRDGTDHSPTTIRCTINDLLDTADKDGFRVRFDYDQPLAVRRVQRLL